MYLFLAIDSDKENHCEDQNMFYIWVKITLKYSMERCQGAGGSLEEKQGYHWKQMTKFA